FIISLLSVTFTSHEKFSTRTIAISTLLSNPDNVVQVVRELDGKELVEFFTRVKNIPKQDSIRKIFK
ncbi:hypothetical protein ACT4UT_36805, partial [Bacillus sp. B-TM1]